eukprot:TRINITY_DN51593_c0_g1_i1.p1 TRINITY_DN51593_c0_g1~~TRINITY_DN51593_c0_g1_i1.p1  ORF type:complete len:284 (+),score=57.41 TRINITY_DN51593_c0_g1_i1:52-852(+)
MPTNSARRGLVTFRVGGEAFELPIPFLSMHSPRWAKRLAEEPEKNEFELEGEAESFRVFLQYLKGEEGQAGEVHMGNLLQLLRWGEEFEVDYVRGACEAFLLHPSGPAAVELSPVEVLEIAARFDMPRLYEKAVEVTGQGMKYIQVPEDEPSTFDAKDLRSDVLSAHLSMGLMCSDAEMRRRHRFADQSSLPSNLERSRLMWKSRARFRQPPGELYEQDWHSLQTVIPHHSLRGEDWVVVPHESQPAIPTRAIPGMMAGNNRRTKR